MMVDASSSRCDSVAWGFCDEPYHVYATTCILLSVLIGSG